LCIVGPSFERSVKMDPVPGGVFADSSYFHAVMNPISVSSPKLLLEIDPQNGRWLSLRGGKTQRSWLAADSDCGFPFVAGTGEVPCGHPIALSYGNGATSLEGRSERGGISLQLQCEGDALVAELTLPPRRGPRSGLILDLDHLDRGDGDDPERNIHDTLMPVMMESADDLSWAWVAWQRAEDDFLITAVDGPSAGWFIRYSYAGHRMDGFQLLARADDVLATGWPDGRLPAPDRLRVKLSLAESREEVLEEAHRLLALCSANPVSSSVVKGGSIALAQACDLTWVQPSGESVKMSSVSELPATQPGQHRLLCRSAAGRVHESRVLVLGDWEALRLKALTTHRERYQLPRGAFARCLNAEQQPEGRNFGGNHFGNPDESGSCRTGEFGGFGAWAQLLMLREGRGDEEMARSVRAYFDWMCNVGREENPGPGTLCFQPHSYEGRDYSPYHFYQEICYAQHESWLIGQLADAVDYGWEELLKHLQGLCEHYLLDHIDASGVIWNQNWVHETPVDYSTVDCPMIHLLRAAEVLQERDADLSKRLYRVCRQQAEHLLNRGFDFPTEGEPCTEDGSIACQAWGLARAYNELADPDPAWLKLAQDLMSYHSKLELSGQDVRVDGSSLRFWETMYETEEWGPSINAGHGWTLWSAFARLELFRATRDFEDLWQLWRHSMCVASRQQENGLFPPCFTPDPIPSLPHDDAWGDPGKRYEARTSSAVAGLRYPEGSSMSGMFLWLLYPRIWSHTYGYDPKSGRLINAVLVDGRVVPHCSSDTPQLIQPHDAINS